MTEQKTTRVSPAIAALNIAVAQGNPAAQYELGRYYLRGEKGVQRDQKKGIRLIRLAAEQEYAKAQNALGSYLLTGLHGLTRNPTEGALLLRLAAEQGYIQALSNLGDCYFLGLGVIQDQKISARLKRVAADHGDVDLQLKLASAYINGSAAEGIQQDHKEAVRLYSLAAAQGHPAGQTKLGACYELGIGVPKDIKKALQQYELAAEQQYSAGLESLAKCYANGIGVEKDFNTAVTLQAQVVEKLLLRNLKDEDNIYSQKIEAQKITTNDQNQLFANVRLTFLPSSQPLIASATTGNNSASVPTITQPQGEFNSFKLKLILAVWLSALKSENAMEQMFIAGFYLNSMRRIAMHISPSDSKNVTNSGTETDLMSQTSSDDKPLTPPSPR